MKLETWVVFIKGAVVFGATTLSAFAGSLAQWSNESGTPTKIQWALIIATSLGAGLTALGAFMSQSFGNYLKTRNGNGDSNGQPPPTVPQPPVKPV